MQYVSLMLKEMFSFDFQSASSVFVYSAFYISRFLQYGASTVTSKKFVNYILTKELGQEKTANLIQVLKRHQYWKTVGLMDIEQMLKYLKMNFTINEICQNIHIILYAR